MCGRYDEDRPAEEVADDPVGLARSAGDEAALSLYRAARIAGARARAIAEGPLDSGGGEEVERTLALLRAAADRSPAGRREMLRRLIDLGESEGRSPGRGGSGR
jgi:hypothetical protein